MEENEGLHSGHRERMLKKFIDNPSSLLEHEVLEALLFYAVPRKDTNPLAHRLINRFGSLEKVFSLSVEELVTVDGVGEKTACLIALIGRSMNIVTSEKQKKVTIFSLKEIEDELREYFIEQKYETSVLLLMDKNAHKMARMEFTDDKAMHVSMNMTEISRIIAVHKPKYAVVAHNHPNGEARPSYEDDVVTLRIKFLCDVQGVTLLDHVIFANKQFFSYHHSGRLEHVCSEKDINRMLIK